MLGMWKGGKASVLPGPNTHHMSTCSANRKRPESQTHLLPPLLQELKNATLFGNRIIADITS